MAKQRHFVEIDKLDDVNAGNNYVEPQDSSQFRKEQSSEAVTQQPGEQPNQGSNIVNNLGNYESYDDITGNKQSYKPNSGMDDNGNPLVGGGSNTGSGVESAIGTDGKPIGYSWEKQGSEKAQKTYANDILTAKQNALNNRSTIENNAVNYQVQADMMKYQNNQNAEKVGWTGGYVLDQNRQMEYLKASIQAQMYGAMELQKYGYDSSLAAARLSYDLNQQEYARQYYEQAVSEALSEAQLTGTYFSAETKDMMSQLAVARQKAEDQSLPESDREQANKLIDTINKWFEGNGISKEGVKALEAWKEEQANELSWSQELWERYNAVLEATKTDLSTNPSMFILLDENGKELWDGNNIATGDWNTLSAKDVGEYIMNGGKLNTYAVQQFYGYIESQIEGPITTGFTKWCLQNKYIKEENGKYVATTTIAPETFIRYLKETNTQHDVLDSYVETFGKDEKYKDLLSNMQNWKFTFDLPDGKQLTYTASDLLKIKKSDEPNDIDDTDKKTKGLLKATKLDDLYIDDSVTHWEDNIKKYKTQAKGSIEGVNFDQYGQNTTVKVTIPNVKTYHLTVDWNLDINNWSSKTSYAESYAKTGGKTNYASLADYQHDQQFLKTAYPDPTNGELAITYVGGRRNLWVYCAGKWGYVNTNIDGVALKEYVASLIK